MATQNTKSYLDFDITLQLLNKITTLNSKTSKNEVLTKCNFTVKSFENEEYIPLMSLYITDKNYHLSTLRYRTVKFRKEFNQISNLKVDSNIAKYNVLLDKFYNSLSNYKYNIFQENNNTENILFSDIPYYTMLANSINARSYLQLINTINYHSINIVKYSNKYYITGKGMMSLLTLDELNKNIIDIKLLVLTTINKSSIKYLQHLYLLSLYDNIKSRGDRAYGLHDFGSDFIVATLLDMTHNNITTTNISVYNTIFQNNVDVYLNKELLNNNYKTLLKTINTLYTKNYKNVKVVENLTSKFFNILQPLPKASSITEQRKINDSLSVEFLNYEINSISEKITTEKGLINSNHNIILI